MILRAVLAILSFLGLLATGLYLLLMLVLGGPKSGGLLIASGVPFAYFLFCFLSSLRRIRGRDLKAGGIVANLVMLVVVVYLAVQGAETYRAENRNPQYATDFRAVRQQTFGAAAVGLCFMGLWYAMYRQMIAAEAREPHSPAESGGEQA
jgi:hypothetical protein